MSKYKNSLEEASSISDIDTSNWDAINPNYVARMRLQNQFKTGIDIAKYTASIMRYEGIDDAYEQLKNLSRGKKLDKSSYKNFVNSLDISDKSKEKLLSLTPAKYIGLAKKV